MAMRLNEQILIDPSTPATVDAQPLAPLVSVLVRSTGRPCLAQALDSVALQTHPRLELVVVAARSGHPPLPLRLGSTAVRLIDGGQALTRSEAANHALDAADGDYLLFLDDDDWLMPGHVAGLLETLQSQPAALAAYSGVALVDRDGRPSGQTFDLPFDSVRQLSGNLTPIHAVLFSTALCKRGCRFDEALDRYEDWDFWLQVARHTVFVHRPGVSAVYRIHDSSGAHADAGAHSDASLRVYDKWKNSWTPQQLAGVMQRVWSHADLEVSLQQGARQQQAAELRLAQCATQSERHLTLLQDQQSMIAQQMQQLLLQQQHVAQQTEAAARHTQRLEEQQRRMAELEHLLARQMQRAERLAVEQQALLGSTSWRVTAPLRALGDLRARRRAARVAPAPSPMPGATPAQTMHADAAPASAANVPGDPDDRDARALSAEAFAPLNFYLLPPHGQRRVSLVIDRLASDADAHRAEPLLRFAIDLANQRGALLRVICRIGAPDGACIDRLLQHQALALARDCVLCHAPWDDASAEFDRLHDEVLITASARNLAAVLASTEAGALMHWLAADEHEHDLERTLKVLHQHRDVRTVVSGQAWHESLCERVPANLGLRLEIHAPSEAAGAGR